jgi:EAL domain-containing protein (putative c-di-GMP-specific phosphodiesterase class I)
MSEARDRVEAGSQEAALLASARRIAEARPSGGWACHIRLSQVPRQRLQENSSFAVNILRSAVERCLGRLFVLQNCDVVVICWQTRRWQMRSAIASLHPLFEPEVRSPGRPRSGEASFVTWWDLDRQSEEFLAFAELLTSGQRGTTAVPPPSPRPSAAPRPARFDPVKLATLVSRIKDANLAGVIRRQAVCLIPGSGPPQPVFEEVYVSIQELQRLFAPGGELGLDRWLFRSLTEVLDERVLAWLAAAESLDLISRFALNLNLSTLASREFANFEAQFGTQLRGRMIVEIDKSDMLGDLSRFADVREAFRSRGYLIGIDGLTGPDLQAVDYGRFEVDLFKVLWHPEFLDESKESRLGLERLIAQASPEKIVLSHCSMGESLTLGAELGVSLFQGWHVDALLRGVQPPMLKLVANS